MATSKGQKKRTEKKPEGLDVAVGSTVAEQRKSLPDEPGVYIFRDASESVIYVGKAKSLRKRVASHFSSKATKGFLITELEQIEFVVTSSEAEALLVEHRLVQQLRPRFNVKLRDDKSYPYIAISLDEQYPRVYFTRERHKSGRLYFGPFSNARRVREILDLLGKVFQYRTCEGKEPGRKTGNPCLDYYIKRCQAPCVDYISRAEYRKNVDAIIAFLRGHFHEVEAGLKDKMELAAEEQAFEQAAVFRDRLDTVRSLFGSERLVRDRSSFDLLAVAVDGSDANAQVFQVREGLLAGRHSFYLENSARRSTSEVVEEFALQYYTSSTAHPATVVVQKELPTVAALSAALEEAATGKLAVVHAQRGERRKLLELAERNAKLAMAQDKLRSQHRRQRRIESLTHLQAALGLSSLPARLECFDVSNLGASHPVASMVVFEDGEPKKSHYRHFNIKSVKGQDDFAAIAEVLRRRFARFEAERERSPYEQGYDESFASLPDVLVIDGGKGQLSSGLKALRSFRQEGVTVVSLAKRIEEVFLPTSRQPLRLGYDDPALQLLQRIRDEAHRFAIGHHRRRRSKAMTGSLLDGLPGVGSVRKRLLLKHFGSPEKLTKASLAELESVPGLPAKVARGIHRALNR